MSSLEDEHVLIDLLQKQRWDDAASRMNTEEGREDVLRRKNEYGWLPFHWACWKGAPFELVEAMLAGYKGAVRVTDFWGRLPLHWACYPAEDVISPRLVRLLLDKYPEGAKVTDVIDELPLHNAAERKAPLEILTMLIEAHPKGVTTRNNNGDLPVHFLAEEASPDEKDDVEKVELLLRPLLKNEIACHFSSRRSDETPLDIGMRFDVLNLLTCVGMRRCSTDVIVTVVNRHPEHLRERGEDGSLPLHLAAANPNLNKAVFGQENLIVKLVNLYPDAAATSNGEGRSPLNLAIESGKLWKEGVEAIADAAKGVRTIRDVGTNLFPFMLAASGANPCITTVYELLRCCPDICKKP